LTATIRIPSQLRTLTGGAGTVAVDATTVAEALRTLEELHPGFAERLFDDKGALRRSLNVFVADEDLRFLDGLDTTLEPGATISIIPAIAGG
jgi:molybdopterin converting factor small subunit